MSGGAAQGIEMTIAHHHTPVVPLIPAPRPLRWVMIDNYDSFTYNIVQLFGVLGVDPMEVYRNDAIDLDGLEAVGPDVIVISPGPCSPDEAGISLATLERFMGRVPMLGVCLGHQCLVQLLGGRVVRAPRLMHGKTSPVFHEGGGLYEGVSNPFEATRYHSLIAERESLPGVLAVSARTWEDEIMGVRHRTLPVFGVQYHPESILTVEGGRILANFVDAVHRYYGQEAADVVA